MAIILCGETEFSIYTILKYAKHYIIRVINVWMPDGTCSRFADDGQFVKLNLYTLRTRNWVRICNRHVVTARVRVHRKCIVAIVGSENGELKHASQLS